MTRNKAVKLMRQPGTSLLNSLLIPSAVSLLDLGNISNPLTIDSTIYTIDNINITIDQTEH